jgi:hypothetical protein
MRSATHVTRDLIEHVPGHSLIAKLLTEWDAGRIRLEGADGVVIDEESAGWFWGVLGERRVAEILARLPEGTTVLHSVPIGSQGADVDHLVVAPSGVYCINTKFHAGANVWTAGYGLTVNGISHAKYLRASAREAGRVAQKLSEAAGFAVPVYPVVAFVDAARFTKTAPNDIDGVRVFATTADQILRLIDTRRELSDDQVARIAEAARRPNTWLRTLRPTAPGAHLAREFDALSAALAPAMSRRSAPRPAARREGRIRGPKTTGQRVLVGVLGGCLIALALPLIGLLLMNLLGLVLGAALGR